MINKKIFILLAFLLIIFIISFIYVSSQNVYEIKLKSGKNYVYFNITKPFYVKKLVELNPEIEVVSYIENNKSIGYVNVFSGIGENFIIYSDIKYEIIVKKDINLILPNEK
ncbi:MAG: hypothetical protein QXW97_00020 [Candidatus Pacearchaeota archaeon]